MRRGHSAQGKSIAKPTLMLAALELFIVRSTRLNTLSDYEAVVNKWDHPFKDATLLYPFARLKEDGIWEVEYEDKLTKTSKNDLLRSEVINKNIRAGFTKDIYKALQDNKQGIKEIVSAVLCEFFDEEQRSLLTESASAFVDESKEHKLAREPQMNNFIAYLNSLHNVTSSGANALAESQALNKYFHEIYEPFPVINDIKASLNSEDDCVVIVTGHAGDGKSTVALDIYKQLLEIPPQDPLNEPLPESVQFYNNTAEKLISIIKDMSELSSDDRLDRVSRAYREEGSWLIISNTGPLLNTLRELASSYSANEREIESNVLENLQKSYSRGHLERHSLSHLPKKTVIINLTRIDNVCLGSKIFSKIVGHSGWAACQECKSYNICPIVKNRESLLQNLEQTEERIRWLYRKITEYEEKLTLRQMVAHMAYSITGGLTCKCIHNHADNLNDTAQLKENYLFSDLFFGYGSISQNNTYQSLRAVELLNRHKFSIYTSAFYEKLLTSSAESLWVSLPDTLTPIVNNLIDYAKQPSSSFSRYTLRRIIYFFGTPSEQNKEEHHNFLCEFLLSPNIVNYESWRHAADITSSKKQQNELKSMCLKVLLEMFSGFSSGQFSSSHDRLYITLRHPKTSSVQPAQIISGSFYFDDFKILYDPEVDCPVLVYQDKVSLPLTLPLLDFITQRHFGYLGGDLEQIHRTKIEWFRAELLKTQEDDNDPNEIRVLRSNIDGQVKEKKFILEDTHKRLEVLQ
ncbi:hypothetical protein HH1059_13300 [Halorhodospira halochloris]|uniref:ScoMcrA-like DNA sulfur-binding domain-containing protein n=1 Tax=Halorhodospira halochloris TaxID=1052 RepID=A0A0X8X9U9_HALHR|nr:hypothetical protein [Halorhodospira halochloris]BAU58039.2 hypothetical protein HH1059_13300 [Halorhodospira halochloris]